jgi:hypothetical protein
MNRPGEGVQGGQGPARFIDRFMSTAITTVQLTMCPQTLSGDSGDRTSTVITPVHR